MSNENPKVLAILRRNDKGMLERVYESVELQKGECVSILPTNKGAILVIGQRHNGDEELIRVTAEFGI